MSLPALLFRYKSTEYYLQTNLNPTVIPCVVQKNL